MNTRFWPFIVLSFIFLLGCAQAPERETFEEGNLGEWRERINRETGPGSKASIALKECEEGMKAKVAECSGRPGWMVDNQMHITDFATDRTYRFEETQQGGCPGQYAGDSYPLHIESKNIMADAAVGEAVYEVTCTIGCSWWECGKEPTEKAVCPPGEFNDVDACLLACKAQGGEICDSKGETPPYCFECRKKCNLDVFAACASKCEPPTACISKCPFITVPCPPGTPPDVVNCANLDETCSRGCLNTANACIDACLKESNCKMHEIPPRLTPNPND